MKSLFFTVLILAGVFLAYDYYLAAPWERLVFQKGPKLARNMQPVMPAREVEDSGAPEATAASAPSASTNVAITIPEIASKDFVPPVVPSLEELTKNWSAIPAHAFPREVKLRRNVDVKMAAGSARIPAGAAAYARSAENGWLTVAPTPTSTASGKVAVADTDLPEQIQQSYLKWKADRIERAHHAWQAKKTAKPTVSVAALEPANLADALDAKGKPMQSKDGSYPLLLASMGSGMITEITPARIRRWGNAQQKVTNGKPVWAVDVWYDTIVYCGPIVAQAQAQVADGKVVSWTYPSGEPVP